jgi:3-methyladenine DNA glycosylase AlkD
MKAQYVLEHYLMGDSRELKNNTLNRKPTLGISYPNLKLISNEIIKSNPIEFLESNDFSIYELEILQTYVIGKLKDKALGIKYFKEFAPYAKEWSVVDSLCQKFIIARKYQKEIFDILVEYSIIEDEYMQRIVSVVLLSHFNNDAYSDASIELIDQLNHPGYYNKMAKAWALATLLIKYQVKIIDYLSKNKLDVWTHNKTIQKATESFRISDELKTIISKLKRQ